MKKRIITLFLAAVMCIVMLPDTAFATQNTSESEPVYLGTEAEYQTTIDTMFDENGLRKVAVGYNSNNGTLYYKEGLVNKYGEYIVQPIYDEIMNAADYVVRSAATTLPSYFVGGYTQAIRDGKMGLINVKGEEVVPCQYDYVGLPSEGVCRVYQHKEKIGANNAYYLGYWSIEKNKEIVAPNKYETPFTDRNLYDYNTGKAMKKPAGDYLKVHDFNGGYALVFTESGYSKNLISDFRKSTVIDKNGKDILGKTYITAMSILTDIFYQDYPQKGSYLAFFDMNVSPSKYKKTEVYKAWQKFSDIKKGYYKLGPSNFTGLVGPKGILIPAEYTSGHYVALGKAEVSFGNARFEIIPDKKLVITSNSLKPRIDIYAPTIVNRYGVLNLNGKKVIPFGNEVAYNKEHQIFVTGGKIYNTAGKVISKRTYMMITDNFTNGYHLAATESGTYNHQYNSFVTTWYVVKADGKEYNLTKALGLGKYENMFAGDSNFNTKGYFWLQRKGGKWGLINYKGKTILPFEYDTVDSGEWQNGKNGYAIVTKNGKFGIVNNAGKEIVPCIYDGFADYNAYANPYYGNNKPSVLSMETKDGIGLIEIATGKIILPAKYDSVQAFRSYGQRNLNYFDMGVYYVERGDKKLLLDKNGKEVFSTTEKFHEAIDGLYYYTGSKDSFDSRGRIIIPYYLNNVRNLEVGDSYTIYVKDKKVYRISANYLDMNYRYKRYQSSSTADNKKIDTYAQSKRDVHKKAREQAIKDPYQNKAIYKEPFVSFRTVPDKVTYKVGDPFETKGFKAVWVDVYGTETDISKEITFDVNGTKIYDGYKFTTSGNKTVNCSYKGKRLNNFKISVISNDAKLK